MSSIAISPPKGSDEERQKWKDWARRNGRVNSNGVFVPQIINDRRRVSRDNLSQRDSYLLGKMESATIELFHFANAVTERWPRTVRVILNKLDEDDMENRPFESWVGPPGLEKRKQSTRVWTDLVHFLVLEYHLNNMKWSDDASSVTIMGTNGYFGPMGLSLSDDLADDIMDVVQADILPMMGRMKGCIHELLLRIIMHENATPQNNPLLFWVALLLQTEEFGNQPRLEFGGLKDELTMREKLEALVHYARVLILDLAYKSFRPPLEQWRSEIEKSLNSRSTVWADRGLPRPADQEGDPGEFREPYWRAFMVHFENLSKKWLLKGSKGPVAAILELL